jgi:hypothetical protein
MLLINASKVWYIHDDYSGWSYGTPSSPSLISDSDSLRLMKIAGAQVEGAAAIFPPVQYAQNNDALYHLTNRNRFIAFGFIVECMDIDNDDS